MSLPSHYDPTTTYFFSGQVYMKICNPAVAGCKAHICSNSCNPWGTQIFIHIWIFQLYSVAEFQDSKRYQTYQHTVKLFLKEGLMLPTLALSS